MPNLIKKQLGGKMPEIMLNSNYYDLNALLNGGKLNDSIVQDYLRIVHQFLIPHNAASNSHIFSPYLLQKLVGLSSTTVLSAQGEEQLKYKWLQQCTTNYGVIKGWTRKIGSLFSKQLIVFPMCGFGHWWCVFLVNPNALIECYSQSKPCLIFCDSLHSAHRYLVAALLRRFLELEALDKLDYCLEISSNYLPCVQPLVIRNLFQLPLQRNNVDCGLFMLSYIRFLLVDSSKLIDMRHNIAKRYTSFDCSLFLTGLFYMFFFSFAITLKCRNQLKLFPTSYVPQIRVQIHQLLAHFSFLKYSTIDEFLINERLCLYGDKFDEIDNSLFSFYRYHYANKARIVKPISNAYLEYLYLLRFHLCEFIYEIDGSLVFEAKRQK